MQRVAALAEELRRAVRKDRASEDGGGRSAMNAMEHGNHPGGARSPSGCSAHPVSVTVEIVDQGGDSKIAPPAGPDLAAKLAGTQSPRAGGCS